MSRTSVLCKYTTYNKPIIHLHAHRVSVQCGKTTGTVEEVEAKKVYFREIFSCHLKILNHYKQVEKRMTKRTNRAKRVKRTKRTKRAKRSKRGKRAKRTTLTKLKNLEKKKPQNPMKSPPHPRY